MAFLELVGMVRVVSARVAALLKEHLATNLVVDGPILSGVWLPQFVHAGPVVALVIHGHCPSG
jgi:hypothetical protein